MDLDPKYKTMDNGDGAATSRSTKKMLSTVRARMRNQKQTIFSMGATGLQIESLYEPYVMQNVQRGK